MHEAQETQVRRKPDCGEQRSDLTVKTVSSPARVQSEKTRAEQAASEADPMSPPGGQRCHQGSAYTAERFSSSSPGRLWSDCPASSMNKPSLRSQFMKGTLSQSSLSPCGFQLRRRMLLPEPLSSFKKDKERHCVQCFTSGLFFFITPNCWMLKTLHFTCELPVCVYVWRRVKT